MDMLLFRCVAAWVASGMNSRKILLGILIVALAGCSLAPSYTQPDLPTAAAYPGVDDVTTGAGPGAGQFGWREFFSDARLKELILQALENNRDLRIAIQRVEEARGLYRIQRADLVPNISAEGAAIRSRVPSDLSVTGRL